MKEADVLVIDVKYEGPKGAENVIITIHQRIDFVYRQTVVNLIKSVCADGDLLLYLQELDDDFLEVSINMCFVNG